MAHNTNPNAWIAIDHGLGTDHRLAPYILVLKGERSLYQAIEEDDWVLVLNPAGLQRDPSNPPRHLWNGADGL